MICVGITG